MMGSSYGVFCSVSTLEAFDEASILPVFQPLTSKLGHRFSGNSNRIPRRTLIVYARPDQDEDARYHIDELLTPAGIAYSEVAQETHRVPLEGSAPFTVTHEEKRVVFALHMPLHPNDMSDLAQMVTIGIILGFVIKGEIALSESETINNLVE